MNNPKSKIEKVKIEKEIVEQELKQLFDKSKKESSKKEDWSIIFYKNDFEWETYKSSMDLSSLLNDFEISGYVIDEIDYDNRRIIII